jgi:hypothetical protein
MVAPSIEEVLLKRAEWLPRRDGLEDASQTTRWRGCAENIFEKEVCGKIRRIRTGHDQPSNCEASQRCALARLISNWARLLAISGRVAGDSFVLTVRQQW